jgi:hypothetical protein
MNVVLRLSAEFEKSGDSMKKILTERMKKHGRKITQYELLAVLREIAEDAKLPTDPVTLNKLKKELTDGGVLEAMGMELTKGMHASEEMRFASEEEALQYLANITGQRVIVADIAAITHEEARLRDIIRNDIWLSELHSEHSPDEIIIVAKCQHGLSAEKLEKLLKIKSFISLAPTQREYLMLRFKRGEKS